jgi:hypothetical protein
MSYAAALHTPVAFPTLRPERVRDLLTRALVLTLVAGAAVLLTVAAPVHVQSGAPLVNDFGSSTPSVVSQQVRPIARELEPQTRFTLRRVRCASADAVARGTSCYIASWRASNAT